MSLQRWILRLLSLQRRRVLFGIIILSFIALGMWKVIFSHFSYVEVGYHNTAYWNWLTDPTAASIRDWLGWRGLRWFCPFLSSVWKCGLTRKWKFQLPWFSRTRHLHNWHREVQSQMDVFEIQPMHRICVQLRDQAGYFKEIFPRIAWVCSWVGSVCEEEVLRGAVISCGGWGVCSWGYKRTGQEMR